jgi:hypothetical protein
VYKLCPATTSSSLSSNPSSISEFEFESEPDESSSSIPETDKPEPQHALLLAPEAVPAIIYLLELRSTAASADLHRAIEQARLRIATNFSNPEYIPVII